LLWFAWGGKDDLLRRQPSSSEIAPSALLLVACGVTLTVWLVFGVTPLILIFLLHGYIGMTGARSVSGGIALAQRRGVYDLMGVTPSGELAGAWAVATRYFRRDSALAGLHIAAQYLRLVWLLGLFPFMGLMVLSMCQGVGINATALQDMFNRPLMAFNGIFVLGVMIVDYPQALAAGGVIGMIAPTFHITRFETQLVASFLFVTYQVLNTGLVLIFHLLVGRWALSSVDPLLRPWLSTVVWGGIFLLIREGGLVMLCAIFARRMRATLREVLTIYRRSI